MDVLKHHPVTFSESVLEFLVCDHVLALSQGHIEEVVEVPLEAHFLADFLNLLDWIGSRGEDKEHRNIHLSLSVGVLNDANQDLVKGQILVHRNEFVSLGEVAINELRHCGDHPVRPHCPDYA